MNEFISQWMGSKYKVMLPITTGFLWIYRPSEENFEDALFVYAYRSVFDDIVYEKIMGVLK